MHGEVTSRHPAAALNYLAFSHFIHWPEDSVVAFGRKTLGQVLGSDDEGERYVRLLAAWDSNELSQDQKHEINQSWTAASKPMMLGKEVETWRFWDWLRSASDGDRRAVSSFF